MDPYVGEIRLWAGNWVPTGWAYCWGQMLYVQQYQALFTIISNIYGGDGRTTFALPDLRSRVPIHQGQGPGLTERAWATTGGSEVATIDYDQMAAHTHYAQAVANTGTTSAPQNMVWAQGAPSGRTRVRPNLYSPTPNVDMAANLVSPVTGGNQAHNNIQPYIALNYIIALEGVYPIKTS